MIRVIMLTGFLGSGKTTLMQLLLSSYEDKKCGVIVNDFGKVNVDARLLKRGNMDMLELENGSIFCACIKDNFVDALIEMSKTDVEYLFIEASGLADPSNMNLILDGLKNATVKNLEMEGSICIVDATSIVEMADMFVSVQRQLEHANAIIVNKMDLFSENNDTIINSIRQYNEKAAIYPTTYCSIEVDKLLNNLLKVETYNNETTNTMDNRPFMVTLKSNAELDYKELNRLVEFLAFDSYRIKGFAQTTKGNVLVNSVLDNTRIEEYNKDIKASEIVVISKIGIAHLNKINSMIDDYFGKDIKVEL